MQTTTQRRPVGFAVIGGFFFFGSVMATYAAFTLLMPGTVLDRGWALNPVAHAQLAALGPIMAAPFCLLASALFWAAVGWFRRRRWGWILGVVVILINLAGDLFNMLRGEWAKGAVGITIAGLLLVYMTRPTMRGYFS